MDRHTWTLCFYFYGWTEDILLCCGKSWASSSIFSGWSNIILLESLPTGWLYFNTLKSLVFIFSCRANKSENHFFSLLPSPGEDISLSISQVLNYRNFCNKMWQTIRFTLGVLRDNTVPLRKLEEVQQRNVLWAVLTAGFDTDHCATTGHSVARCSLLVIRGF